MKRSIYKPASVYAIPTPFPMPEPQRTLSMRILVTEARSAKVPPAMLVTHLPQGEDRMHSATRALVMRRILAEVEGVSVRMLARAFRRDAHRIRDLVKEKNKEL